MPSVSYAVMVAVAYGQKRSARDGHVWSVTAALAVSPTAAFLTMHARPPYRGKLATAHARETTWKGSSTDPLAVVLGHDCSDSAPSIAVQATLSQNAFDSVHVRSVGASHEPLCLVVSAPRALARCLDAANAAHHANCTKAPKKENLHKSVQRSREATPARAVTSGHSEPQSSGQGVASRCKSVR